MEAIKIYKQKDSENFYLLEEQRKGIVYLREAFNKDENDLFFQDKRTFLKYFTQVFLTELVRIDTIVEFRADTRINNGFQFRINYLNIDTNCAELVGINNDESFYLTLNQLKRNISNIVKR